MLAYFVYTLFFYFMVNVEIALSLPSAIKIVSLLILCVTMYPVFNYIYTIYNMFPKNTGDALIGNRKSLSKSIVPITIVTIMITMEFALSIWSLSLFSQLFNTPSIFIIMNVILSVMMIFLTVREWLLAQSKHTSLDKALYDFVKMKYDS